MFPRCRKRRARSGTRFPLVGVTEEVGRVASRSLPQDDPARQPPFFNLIPVLPFDHDPAIILPWATSNHSACDEGIRAVARSRVQMPWIGTPHPGSFPVELCMEQPVWNLDTSR